MNLICTSLIARKAHHIRLITHNSYENKVLALPPS